MCVCAFVNEDCFRYFLYRNILGVLFRTLKVRSFIFTEVSDNGLLILIKSSAFLNGKDKFKQKRQSAQIIKTRSPAYI